jgi:hypothetical protein
MTPEAEVLYAVITELEAHRISYMVVGSFATGRWGRPRATHDVDLVIEIPHEQATEFAATLAKSLEGQFFADTESMVRAVYRHSMFNLIHYESSFKADVWILKNDEYEQVAFVRRVRKRFFGENGFDAFVASPEDTILSKLLWYQQTTWERDFLDALGVYEVQAPELDQAYLGEWAAPLGLAALLERIRREAAPATPPTS